MASVRVVELETDHGLLRIELYDDAHPIHLNTPSTGSSRTLAAESFARLAMSGQLEGPLFQHLLPGYALVGEAAQSEQLLGIPMGWHASGSAEHAELPTLHHVGAGIVSCSSSADAIPASRFLLTLSPQPGLDAANTIFGRVYSGMDVLQRIAAQQVGAQGQLVNPVVVRRSRVTNLPVMPRPTAA